MQSAGRKNNLNKKNVYPEKLYFKTEGEIKSSPGKQLMGKFVDSRSALQ